MRHAELLRIIEGVSQKMLTQTLRKLELDGLLVREVVSTTPLHVDYSLSALGATLKPIVTELRTWAENHLAEVEQHRERNLSGPHRSQAS